MGGTGILTWLVIAGVGFWLFHLYRKHKDNSDAGNPTATKAPPHWPDSTQKNASTTETSKLSPGSSNAKKDQAARDRLGVATKVTDKSGTTTKIAPTGATKKADGQESIKMTPLDLQSAFVKALKKAINDELGDISILLNPVRDVDLLSTDEKRTNVVVQLSRNMSDLNDKEKLSLSLCAKLNAKHPAFGQSFIYDIGKSIIFNDGNCRASLIKGKIRRANMGYILESFKLSFPTSSHSCQNMMGIISKLQNQDPSFMKITNEIMNKGSSFASNRELPNTIFTESDGNSLYIGKFDVDISAIYGGELSCVTIAPPGSGKSQCHVIPNLLSYEGPAFVLDVKGECYRASADWRRENVGPVYRFDPVNPDQSHSFNPLAFVRDDEDYVWEDARFMANMLIVPQSKSDPGWETQGRDLLALIIANVALFQNETPPTMVEVLDRLAGVGLDEMFDDLTSPDAPVPSAMRRAAKRFQDMRNEARKQFEGILSGATQHLSAWDGPRLERVTKSCDWKPEDLRNDKPPTIYLCIPANEIDNYASVLRVIIGLHVRRLMLAEPDRSAAQILFMLDELPRLGEMAPIREALEAGRSYGIKLWMFAQYVGQLQEAYGREIADGMIGSCGVRIYMNPDAETAEKLSKQLGERESLLDGKKQPLVTPQELSGPEWKNDMLVLVQGEKPLRLKKQFAFETQQAAS